MTKWQKRLAKQLGAPGVRREMAVGRASAALSTLIAQRLEAKGMTQEQLAEALGITPGAVSRKLKEGCDMRLSSVAAILWTLDVPLHRELELLCGFPSARGKSPSMAETASMVAESSDTSDDIPELTKADFARAIPRRQRERLIRGDLRGGADIVALRRFTGLTRKTFADALGISVHTLGSWEQGSRKPEGPALALIRIAARDPRVLEANLPARA